MFRAAPTPTADLLAFALTAVTTHLLVKRSWGYHYVTMTFVYATLIGAVGGRRFDRGATRWIVGGVAMAALMQNFYSPMIVGKQMSGTISSYGPTTLSFVVLAATLVLGIFRLNPDRGSSKTPR
ncbi:MAG: hypothetical protein HY815_27355 [Candidatus Riflebacteria bacterium]|nr:hypothetical protein [Candidatus Riflebacteria bacterium]